MKTSFGEYNARTAGWNFGQHTIESDDDIITDKNELFDKFKSEGFTDDSLFENFKEGYSDFVDNFLEISHSTDYDSDYFTESTNKLNEKHFGVEQYFDCANYPNQLLQVENFIKNCEDEGHLAILTVQSTEGRVWHTQFTSDSWKKFLNSLHGTDDFSRNSGVTNVKDGVAKVWAKEVDPKDSLGESWENFFDRIAESLK